jgi:adenine deaminase
MNIAVVGTSDEDMAHAVNELRRRRGGFITVADGSVLGAVDLPIGGMMSNAPWEETAVALREAHAATRAIGCTIESPYIILSFVGLAGVPDLGLTELGLIDSVSQAFVPVLVGDPVPVGS